MVLKYAGPALLQSQVSRWFPNQITIFHRVEAIDFGNHGNKISLLTKFHHLKTVNFYNYEKENSLQQIQTLFPTWKLSEISGTKKLALSAPEMSESHSTAGSIFNSKDSTSQVSRKGIEF